MDGKGVDHKGGVDSEGARLSTSKRKAKSPERTAGVLDTMKTDLKPIPLWPMASPGRLVLAPTSHSARTSPA
eukprot:6707014-Pyramimonas_sp.AAC.1